MRIRTISNAKFLFYLLFLNCAQRHSSWLGRTMVRILARRSRAEIPMARSNEPTMSSKDNKKLPVGRFDAQNRPNERDIKAMSG